jgi:hypothetical protein
MLFVVSGWLCGCFLHGARAEDKPRNAFRVSTIAPEFSVSFAIAGIRGPPIPST